MAYYILADNQELTRHAVEHVVFSDRQNTVSVASDKARLTELLREHERAIVVLDYTLFDFADVNQLVIMSERFAEASWLLLSNDLTAAFLSRVLYASHSFSVLFKDCALSELREALSAMQHGGRHFSQRAMEAMLARPRPEEDHPEVLTATEIEILKSVAMGHTTKEIAAERFLSIHTVNTHKKNIFRKLQVNTAFEATRYALRAGLVDSSEFYI